MCINPSVQFQKVTFPFVRRLVFSVQVTENEKTDAFRSVRQDVEASAMCRKIRKRDLFLVDPILLISFRGAQHKTVRALKHD